MSDIWSKFNETKPIRAVEQEVKIQDLRFVKVEDSVTPLASWSIANNKVNPKSKCLEIQLENGMIFSLLYKKQQEDFTNLYMNKSTVFLKVNQKGFSEICLTQIDIDVVKAVIKKNTKSTA